MKQAITNSGIENIMGECDIIFERNKSHADIYNQCLFVGISGDNIVFSCVCSTIEKAYDKLVFQFGNKSVFVKLKEVKGKLKNPLEYTFHLIK